MAVLGSWLAVLHGWLALASAALAVGVVALGAIDGLGRVRGRRWLDRLVLVLLATTIVTVVLGIGVVAGVGPPGNGLHFVYAAAAVAAVPAARAIAGARRSPRPGWWLAAGGLVTVGALLQLWATGG